MNTSELEPVCRSRVKRFSIFVIIATMLGILTNSNVASADSNEAPADGLNQPVQSSIALGWFNSCLVVSDQTVRCWGSDEHGALGNGSATTTTQDTPVTVSNLTGVKAVTAGNQMACALLVAGTVKCWGSNEWGQLGNGTGITNGADYAQDKDQPVFVDRSANDSSPLSGVTAISTGAYHTCALLSNKTVVCWGYNSDGQLGNSNATPRQPTPIPVTGLTNVTAIAAGQKHTCALLADKTVKCWGDGEVGSLGHGEPPINQGNNTFADKLEPTPVAGLTGVAAISLGRNHSCALLVDKTVRCWGYNYFGQLGDETNNWVNQPVPVTRLSDAIAISAGDYHTCAVLEDTSAKCWGANTYGQVGDDTKTNRNTPVDVLATSGSPTPLKDVKAINAGLYHTCAVLSSSVSCWGDNSQKQLGVGPNGGSDIKIPTPVVPANGDSIAPVQPLDPPPPPAPDNNSSGNNTAGDNNATNNSSGTTNNTLSPGQFNATVNGQPVNIDVTSTTEGQVIINGSDFSLTFDSPTSGNNNALFLPLGGAVTFNGEGYKSNSRVTSTLTSTNTNVGNSKVSKNGSFSSRINVPRGTRSGNHQLSVNGIARNGAPRNITLGVSVNTLKKRTVKLFGVYSTKLKKKLRKQTQRIVKEIPPLTAAHCQGFVAPNKISNPRDIKRAKQRARAVCRFIKKRNRAVHTTIGVAPTTQNRRQVLISYR